MTRSAVPLAAQAASASTRDGCSVLGEQVAAMRFESLDAHTRITAMQCMLDGLGVAIAATGEPAVRAVREVVLA